MEVLRLEESSRVVGSVDFLMPEVFGSQETFHSLFNLEEMGDVNEKERMIRQLHQVLEPFMLRRLKSDVETTLPVRMNVLSDD